METSASPPNSLAILFQTQRGLLRLVSMACLCLSMRACLRPYSRYTRGVQAKFAFNASSASKGAVLDAY